MQKADLFLHYVNQFETVRSEYRKLASKWNREVDHGDPKVADAIWENMEGLKTEMVSLKNKAEKLKIKK